MTETYCPECADLLTRDHCCPCCGWTEPNPEEYRKPLRRKMRSHLNMEGELCEQGDTV